MSNDPYAGWAMCSVAWVVFCAVVAYAPRTPSGKREDEDAGSNEDPST